MSLLKYVITYRYPGYSFYLCHLRIDILAIIFIYVSKMGTGPSKNTISAEYTPNGSSRM